MLKYEMSIHLLTDESHPMSMGFSSEYKTNDFSIQDIFSFDVNVVIKRKSYTGSRRNDSLVYSAKWSYARFFYFQYIWFESYYVNDNGEKSNSRRFYDCLALAGGVFVQ